ncbi:MAG: hypothetical protein M1834_004260 [Cirrosporium novae-zelandiae]|nr:MAG: hypothetical protein M1834_004260 [Cirrosporium novae-zelandiae]
MDNARRIWWKDATVYQIWPASFKDSNGDGMGDIQGIISKLDYLKELGIDIIWLSPMYQSPQHDMGYDISNYEDVYPPYGTLADMELLLDSCHIRGMRLILDLVINHTSYLHPWFQESRMSKNNPKRDWYIWRPAKYENGTRKPPTNWQSVFCDSTWTWDETTQEYYFHLFAPEQPDLNWEAETTRDAIYKSSMFFWLDKGVDGFRVDTVNLYSKDSTFPDAPIADPSSDLQPAAQFFANGPRIHEFLDEMNTKVLSKYDVMTVGELPATKTAEKVLEYVGSNTKRLNMVFQFDLVTLGHGVPDRFETKSFLLRDLKNALSSQQYIADNGGWSTAFIENHDVGRSISRFGSEDPKYRAISGKMLAMMLITMTGTLYIYQGQEIGMINCPADWSITEYKDVVTQTYFNLIKSTSSANESEVALAKAMKAIGKVARDHSRSPMHWDDSPNAGFTSGMPWTRVHDLYKEINVKDQLHDPSSLLLFWKGALALRKKYINLFAYGNFQIYDLDNESTVVYTKAFESDIVLVVLNFTSVLQPFVKPATLGSPMKLLLSNIDAPRALELSPWEGRVYILSRSSKAVGASPDLLGSIPYGGDEEGLRGLGSSDDRPRSA